MGDFDKIWDVNKYPLHMQRDAIKHNENVKNNRHICHKCEGTGNQLWSMYQECTDCDGKGYYE